MYRVTPFLSRFAGALLAGAVLASLWVNLAPGSYYDAIEFRLFELSLPAWLSPLPFGLTPLWLVGEGLMALFFFLLGKELWEALVLERGALNGRAAALPLGLALGGMVGAVGLWAVSLALLGPAAGLATGLAGGVGWQVPLGSDVLLCFLFGRLVFGPGHPALRLLVLLAALTDVLALLVLGLTQPFATLRPAWLVLPVVAPVAVWYACGREPGPQASERKRRLRQALWPYIAAGLTAWVGVVAAGLPGALGLLPVIPAIARTDRSFGLFAAFEAMLHDPLNRLVRLASWPLTVILFLFGLTRGGVDLAAFGPATLAVLASLWIGRPLGLLGLGFGLTAVLGLRLPAGVSRRDLRAIAVLMAMGFCVPLLATGSVLPGGALPEAARLGLALSLLAGPLALLALRRSPAAGTSA